MNKLSKKKHSIECLKERMLVKYKESVEFNSAFGNMSEKEKYYFADLLCMTPLNIRKDIYKIETNLYNIKNMLSRENLSVLVNKKDEVNKDLKLVENLISESTLTNEHYIQNGFAVSVVLLETLLGGPIRIGEIIRLQQYFYNTAKVLEKMSNKLEYIKLTKESEYDG